MPIQVICKACGTMNTAPDTAAGGARLCKACGNSVAVPALAAGGKAKVCRICAIDLSESKRYRQSDGTYECAECFENKAARGTARVKTGASRTPLIAEGGSPDLDPARVPSTPASRRSKVESNVPVSKHSAGDQYLEQELTWPGDQADIGAAQSSSTDAVYYPCRICEELFTASEVIADGREVICRPCAKGNGSSALPAGLELTKAASAVAGDSEEGVFCERCNRIFALKKLKTLPGGSIMCKKCARQLAIDLKTAERQRIRLARFTDKVARPRNTSYVRLIACILGGLGGIALLAWRLKVAGVFEQVHHGPPQMIAPK